MKKTEQLTISVPVELKKEIDKISEVEERSRSTVISRLIKLALKDYKNDK